MLARRLSSVVDFKGKRYKLYLAFDNVLRFYELQADTRLDDVDKVEIGFEILVGPHRRLSIVTKAEILRKVFEDFIAQKSKKNNTAEEKIIDFVQDAPYIYSSFWLDYGIDLQEEIGKLDWRKFIALFQGLSEKTKIKEIMGIRARKIPSPTQYNGAEIQNLMQLKTFYALEVSEEERQENFQRGLDKLADTLAGRAKKSTL